MARAYIGLDIGASSIRAVLLRKQKRSFSVSRCRVVPFSAQKVFPSGLTEKGDFDKKILMDCLAQLLDSFSEGEERLSLSLPESAGRLILTEVDTHFSSKNEGREFLRWQLKKLLPLDPGALHLDYQVLKKNNASQQLLVSLASRRMVEQLEETLEEAGFFVSLIDFHSLNCFNYYYSIFEGGDNFCFICVEDGILNFFYFVDRTLSYFRSRSISEKGESIFYEIQRSTIDCQNKHSEILQNPLFFHTESNFDAALFSSLNSFFSGRTVFLEAGLEKFFQKKQELSPEFSQNLVAAVGAAKRLMTDR